MDLEEFLRRRGEKLITSGRDKRLASDHSITIRGCEWFDHATEQGGRAISFVKQFYGLSYPDAMSLLLGDDLGGSYPAAREKEPEPAKPFTLPAQSESMRRVYAFEEANDVVVPYQIAARRQGDLPICYADTSKSTELLGWRAEKSLIDMCRDTWNWQKQNPDGYGG